MGDASEDLHGRLSIVATPIGNMGDLTFRALWNMKECDAIYAEDTRVVSKLLAHYGLRTSVQRLDAATEAKKASEVIERLERGEHIVYVTDAGTPGISDPGARLVARVREALPSAAIDAIPGASALTAALSIAGIDSSVFIFLGFPPHKKGRQTFVKNVSASAIPVVLYESPHRAVKLMKELDALVPESRITVAREITKMHEEVLKGTPREVAELLATGKKERGEFVVIVEP
jgi:16S rRNA (cytidine1402-2'-O)-methyltransferase